MDAREQAAWASEMVRALREEIGRVIVGHDEVVHGVLTCLFVRRPLPAGGRAGAGQDAAGPDLAKTLDLEFSRIQFTPDLMPADILGHQHGHGDGRRQRGSSSSSGPDLHPDLPGRRDQPRHAQDAVGHAGDDAGSAGHRRRHPLPAKRRSSSWPRRTPSSRKAPTRCPRPSWTASSSSSWWAIPTAASWPRSSTARPRGRRRHLGKILDAEGVGRLKALVREVPLAAHVRDYAIRLALATRPGTEASTELVTKYVRYGASPGGPQALVLAAKANALFDGRLNAGFDDVKAAAHQALRHRVLFNFEGEAEGLTAEQVIDDVVARTPVGGDPTRGRTRGSDGHARFSTRSFSASWNPWRSSRAACTAARRGARTPRCAAARASTSPTIAATSPATTSAPSTGASTGDWTSWSCACTPRKKT